MLRSGMRIRGVGLGKRRLLEFWDGGDEKAWIGGSSVNVNPALGLGQHHGRRTVWR